MKNIEYLSDVDKTAMSQQQGLMTLADYFNPAIHDYIRRGVDGYTDFVEGALENEVELAGFATRRPNLNWVRKITENTVPVADVPVKCTGSHKKKAQFLLDSNFNILLDDTPHKIGAYVMQMLGDRKHTGRKITLVTPKSKDQDFVLNSLHREIYRYGAHLNFTIKLLGHTSLHNLGGIRSFRNTHIDAELNLVQLDHYSRDAGLKFAEQMHAIYDPKS